jgi:hypothetical protein
LATSFFIPAREQELDHVAVLAAVDHFHRRQVGFGRQQFADHVFQVVGLRVHVPTDAADDGAVAQDQHAHPGRLLVLGADVAGNGRQKRHEA